MDFNQHQLTKDMWISNLAKNPSLAILAVNGFGKLVLLHNVSFLQENLFCSESKVLGLCGDDAQADVYRIDPDSASSSLELQTPLWRDLKNLQPGADLNGLLVPDQNPPMARFKNSMWIPPLVSTSILEAKNLSPEELIPLLSAKFQEFDKSSPNVKACTTLRPVLEFLWAVHKKLVPQTIMAVENSSDALDWGSRLHFAYIHAIPTMAPPPPFPAPPAPSTLAIGSPFKQMTDELRKIREANERHLLNDSQGTDSKKETNGWDKLPDMVQKMLYSFLRPKTT
jgi:hypothetical protein